MTRVLVSTVRRGTPPIAASGHLYVIELEDRRVIRRSAIIEPAYRLLDTQPRGGMRGSKGVSVLPDQVAVANSSIVFRFNPQWEFLGLNTHRVCSYIHDILAFPDCLWAASAGTDMVVQFDAAGNLARHVYLREPSPALEALDWAPPLLIDQDAIHLGGIDFRDPSTYEDIAFDNAHVNSLAALPNGDLLVSLGLIIDQDFAALVRGKPWLMRKGLWPYVLATNRGVGKILKARINDSDSAPIVRPATARSAVVRITPEGERRLVFELPDMTTPSHSLLVLPDETAIYLNSSASEVIRFEPYSGEILSSAKLPEGFLRGSTLLADHLLLVGSQNQLVTFDLNSQSVVTSFQFSEDPVESVYDVKALPPQYALPPESFPDHIGRATGCSSPEELIRVFDPTAFAPR